MNNFQKIEDQLKKLSKENQNVSFRKEDKNLMRSELSEYTQNNPASTAKEDTLAVGMSFFRGAMVGVLGAVLVGGSAVYAAESTLPGESLYPVKVNFNEKVRSIAAVSDEAEARLQAQLAERRIQEVGRLAAEGRLSNEEEQDLQARFERHSDASQDALSKITGESRNEKVIEIQSEFEAAIEANENLLAGILGESNDESGAAMATIQENEDAENATSTASSSDVETSGDNESEIEISSGEPAQSENEEEQSQNRASSLAGVQNALNWLQEEREEISRERSENEARLWGEVSAQVDDLTIQTRALANMHLESARRVLERNQARLSRSVVSEVEEYIRIAEKDIEQGNANISNGENAEAFQTYREAMRRALTAKALVNTSLEYDDGTRLENIDQSNLEASVGNVLESRSDGSEPKATTTDDNASSETAGETPTEDSENETQQEAAPSEPSPQQNTSTNARLDVNLSL